MHFYTYHSYWNKRTNTLQYNWLSKWMGWNFMHDHTDISDEVWKEFVEIGSYNICFPLKFVDKYKHLYFSFLYFHEQVQITGNLINRKSISLIFQFLVIPFNSRILFPVKNFVHKQTLSNSWEFHVCLMLHYHFYFLYY